MCVEATSLLGREGVGTGQGGDGASVWVATAAWGMWLVANATYQPAQEGNPAQTLIETLHPPPLAFVLERCLLARGAAWRVSSSFRSARVP